MSDKFKVEIISPEQKILNTEASEVTIPSYEGQMGILKDHIPLITFLRPGFISVKNKVEINYFVEEGTVEFSDNSLLILTSSAKDLKNLQKNSLNNLLKEAERKIKDENFTDKDKFVLSHKVQSLREIIQ
ncbi:ATP synthase F1 subunit epsilon [Candidatus Pelagibacter bacterium]|nr:ATP synthase F1 subunit epsilon [Candidatus Pelagibacter bacterium]